MTLTQHQQTIFDKILSDIKSTPNFIGSLTGYAGTGKTILTTEIVRYFLKQNKKVDICTPTHKSLKVIQSTLGIYDNDNIKFKTIHSYCGLKLKQEGPLIVLDAIQGFASKTAEILIIDESSMISNIMFDFLIEHIKKQRIKVVLFVGDDFQLLPVESENEQTKSNSKHNKVYSLEKQYKLEEVVRQRDTSSILYEVDKIRNEIINKTFNKKVLNFKESANISLVNTEKEFIKAFCLDIEEDKVMLNFTNSSTDKFNLYAKSYVCMKQQKEFELYSPGDILVLQNGTEEIKNGSEIEIVSVKESSKKNLRCYSMKVRDIYSGSTYMIDILHPDSLEEFNLKLKTIASGKMWKLYWETKEAFTEVKHAFSCTVHKSQGSTFKNVYINLDDFMKNYDRESLFRLLYVAMTRPSTHLTILKS